MINTSLISTINIKTSIEKTSIKKTSKTNPVVAIIGGGPAGLMAAEVLAKRGVSVAVYDAMPSVGRKFLMAGKGGMNITHAEDFSDFVTRYRSSIPPNLDPNIHHQLSIENLLHEFSPNNLRQWIKDLGLDTFVGSSGRVFPTDMKAAPLLRAWLTRLRELGVTFHMRHRWLGWNEQQALRFLTPEGEISIKADALILALGGASWPQLGSDGAWTSFLQQREVEIAPLRPANCGFEIAWSSYFKAHYAGEPLKSVAVILGELYKQGECVISEHGIEGGLIYAASALLREAIEASGYAILQLDLLPDWSLERVQKEVAHARGSRSITSHLQSRLGLKGVKLNLLREVLGAEQMHNNHLLASAIKALPLKLYATRPISEAISTAGGILFKELNSHLMIKKSPGIFCAGEMLDWEAPTGGYLLSACFASGHAAGLGTYEWLKGDAQVSD